jgi:WD40 repeat protein
MTIECILAASDEGVEKPRRTGRLIEMRPVNVRQHKTHNTHTPLRLRAKDLQSPPRSCSTPSASSKMSKLIPITTPLREFKGHEDYVMAVAVFHDKRRMVTGSWDSTLRLWDLEKGVMLKKMEGHSNEVLGLAISRDGQLIASSDEGGEVIVWHGETGESLTQPIKAHSSAIYSLDFSPDGTVLATSSWDKTTKLWNTKTWQPQGNPSPVWCDYSEVNCIQYSPSGKVLAIATSNIQIYNPGKRKRI